MTQFILHREYFNYYFEHTGRMGWHKLGTPEPQDTFLFVINKQRP